MIEEGVGFDVEVGGQRSRNTKRLLRKAHQPCVGGCGLLRRVGTDQSKLTLWCQRRLGVDTKGVGMDHVKLTPGRQRIAFHA
jgi:hypothetical protein